MTGTADNELPALESNRLLRFVAFAALYAAQGLPWGMFIIGIPAWLAGQGASAAEIGSFVAIVALPWSFKLIAGPIMDRFTYLPMGRRRPWVLGAQLGILVGTLLLILVPSPADNLMLLASVGFLINSFCALQDVAVDGMAIDVLPIDERARANAFMYGGQVVGISGSSAAGTWLLSNVGLGAAAGVIACAVLLILLIPLCFRERKGERLLPWTAGVSTIREGDQSITITAIFYRLISALFLPMSLLLILCGFLERASAGLFLAIAPIVTIQELDWADTDYANLQAVSGVGAAVFGVIVSPFVDKKGASLALVVSMGLKLILFLVIGFGPAMWATEWFFEGAILGQYFLSQIVTIAIVALFMNVCTREVAATQFAVYMASSNLSFAAGSAIVATFSALGNANMFLIGAGMNLLFLMLWPFFSLESHEARLRGTALSG